MSNVYIGAFDWRHPDWRESFYPADMPEEWWLTYYNTQYSCVWLPWSTWQGLSTKEAGQYLNDVHESFRFVLETSSDHAQSASTEADALLAVLAPRLGKICPQDDPDLLWFARDIDLRVFTARIQAWRGAHADDDVALYLLSRDGDLATVDKVATLLSLLGL